MRFWNELTGWKRWAVLGGVWGLISGIAGLIIPFEEYYESFNSMVGKLVFTILMPPLIPGYIAVMIMDWADFYSLPYFFILPITIGILSGLVIYKVSSFIK